MKLTPAAARDAKPGDVLRDHEVKGLSLRAGAERKSWQFYYTTRAGDERRPTIGHFPDMSLSRARGVAQGLKDRVAQGEDPSADWKAAKAAPTVADLAGDYVRDWVLLKNGERWAREVEYRLAQCILPGLGFKRVAEVTRADVDRFLADVLARKYTPATRRQYKGPTAPGSANHCRAILSKMFNLAEEKGLRPQHSNPVRFAERATLRKRKVVATPDALPEIAAAMERLQHKYPEGDERRVRALRQVACLWTLFLTGGRVGEVLDATGLELQADGLVKVEHKTARHIGDKTIHVPRLARELLDRLPPHPTGRLFGKIRLRRAWEQVRTEAGCPTLQMRDIRRTFASYALSIGVTLEQVGDHFGHTDVETTKGYSWMLKGARADMVERVADHITATAGRLAPALPTLGGRFRFRPLRLRGLGQGNRA